MAAVDTINDSTLLLTPPPEAFYSNTKIYRNTMDTDTYSSSVNRRPTHPLDDSPEEDHAERVLDQEEARVLDRNNIQQDPREFMDEDTILTHTTTTKVPKNITGLKGNLEELVVHHQTVHQKLQSSPLQTQESWNEAQVEDGDSTGGPASNDVTTTTTMTTTAQAALSHDESSQTSSATALRAPSASLGTLSDPNAAQSPDVTTFSISSDSSSNDNNGNSHALQQQHLLESLRTELSASPSSSSIASNLSSGPGTPNSSNDYHTISTTSTVTRKKRQVRRPTFEPRSSRLDPETLSKNQDPFRGFHTLFWIVMGAYGLITFDEEWTRVGKAFGGTLFSSFSQDAIMLAISDLGLVFSTGIAFVLIKVISKEWLRYRVAGMVIQHCVQILFLLSAIAWTIWRDWPWVQSGFFTLHAITMLMKIHSYIAYNGELSEKSIQLRKNEAAYALIKKTDVELVDDTVDNSNNDDADSSSSSDSIDNSSTDSLVRQQKKGDSRRRHHRLASVTAEALLQDPASNPTVSDANLLASDIDELKSELRCQNGELWPANVTLANFVDYLIVPSLIYELQYPRTTKIRPMYVFEKSVATLGTFTLLYLTTEHYIYPVVFDPTISPMRALVLLMIPFMMNYLMIFYIIFECICNAFAELSRFADRNFYEDWWNCVSFDEWARKWNKPVHHFLLRHVYDSSIESFHLSKSNAALATFFLSSCVHELVMMVVTRKVRLYLFALQMFQLPLIWMGNNKTIREQPRLANAVFWLGMFCGPPLLGVAYCYA
ncbi:hypothetical protein EDD11_002179 [Mortierella claussenii]|nr:hypothetical protein EDD11_002179 [Mortierella claussenii]